MGKSTPYRRISVYLVLTFTLSIPFYVPGGTGLEIPISLLQPTIMLVPGIAAVLASVICRRPLREIGWRWGRTRYQAISYLLPLLYAVSGYSVIWAMGLGGFYDPNFLDVIRNFLGMEHLPAWIPLSIAFVVSCTVPVFNSLAVILGEEIGWRGFLVPELSRMTSFSRTALISGGVWATWHFPGIIFGGYNRGGPTWYSLLCFTMLLILISTSMAWLRLKSGSIWTAVLLHAVHNAVIQNYLTPLTINTGSTHYFIDEFGVGLLPFAALAAYAFWRRRREVEQPAAIATGAAVPAAALRQGLS